MAQEEATSYIPVTDLSAYHMKLLPQTPKSSDKVVLVVYDECQYNLLSSVSKAGDVISIEKHFNSMMKLPCMLRNDTIQIGQLQPGSYTLRYRLLDLSTVVKDPIVLAISTKVTVASN